MESRYSDTLLYDAILSDIYASASVGVAGCDYLQSINQLLDADSTTLVIADRCTNEIIEARGAGITQHTIESPASPYAQHLWSLEPIPQTREAANVFQTRDFHSNHTYREFFRECLRPYNLAPFLSVNISIDQRRNLCLRLARLEGQQDFGPAELGVAKNLARHLSGAQRALLASLQGRRELDRTLANAANRLRVGIFVVDDHGKLIFSPAVLEQLFQLTPSESIIAARLAVGMSIDEIATALCRSRNTIRAHSRSIHRKLEINNQAQLAGKILGSLAGLIAPDEDTVDPWL